MPAIRLLVFAVVSFLAFAAACRAADRIRLTQGNPVSGEVTAATPTSIAFTTGTRKREFPINEVLSVVFDGEPNELSQARVAVEGGRYADALAMLEKVDAGKIKRPLIAADVAFYQALAAARLALGGSGSIAEAGKRMFAFEKAHANSFHHFATCEALGDLLAALGRFADAEGYYNKLAAAPWPDYQMRAGVLVGRALAGQKKYDEAIARFDQVLSTEAKGDGAESQKSAAALGKAAALTAAGKAEDAVQLINDVIARANPDNDELHARAYNALGNCHKAAGRNKEALQAFLHVDLLYARFGELHAEALANLATLWTELGKAERGAQARELLQEKYPASVWAAK